MTNLVPDTLIFSGEIIESLVVQEIRAAIQVAEAQGIQHGTKMVVKTSSGNSWELIFEAASAATNNIPKLFHMLKVG